uniref:O-fucosyltransferase family protein n=1 Tax=Eucampia antarctica TaxID=49252 RepID=A0A7S2W8P9_9STRA|mmetsp:Transcript_22894/g.22003  ORF Transcript_22894/g.22003 Transcript_22894/m.22003 type:complete len:565 (+) Transcript_22894:105-1799(+)
MMNKKFKAFHNRRGTPIRALRRPVKLKLLEKILCMCLVSICLFSFGFLFVSIEVLEDERQTGNDFRAQLNNADLKTKNVEHFNDADPKANTLFVDRLSMSQTPALIGARKAKIKCDSNVDYLAYWNDPQGTQDINFKSPFLGDNSSGETKYLAFAPDIGGWNNVRMGLESILVLAAATGRTLVLPPNKAIYLMNTVRGFGDFLTLHNPEFLKKVPIISTEEFIEREGKENGRFPIPVELQFKVNNAKKECFPMKIADNSCFAVDEYFEKVGYEANITAERCFIFDEDIFKGSSPSDENQKKIENFCGEPTPFFLTQELQQETLIHIGCSVHSRLFGHFYGIMLFTDPVIDNHYKRFVRDFLHYHDAVYCAAGKIVNTMQDMAKELAKEKGFLIDPGISGFSTIHVRRGDFQFKEAVISGQEWNDNLQDVWLDDEIVYIATDEKNKRFFAPIAKNNHILMYLDDFWDIAGLGDLDPNCMGMIDTIVASRGRTFSGTWFSTFTGYINRLRGYHGISMKSSYYGYSERRNVSHTWKNGYISPGTYQYEWPTGWIGIDGDVVPNRDSF